MRRLAMIGVFVGLIASAQWGAQISSRAADRPSSALSGPRATTLDLARASVPLPRTVAVAPTPPSPADERAQRVRATRTPARAARSAVGGGGNEGVWAALARCESGGNPASRSGNGQYFGAFQFSVATWHALGMSGNPADSSYETQLGAARRLQARAGWGQWPRCSRSLGLR